MILAFFNLRKFIPVMIVLSVLIIFSSFIFVTHQTSSEKVLALFHGQPVYKEFKDRYPDAYESFSRTNPFVLEVAYRDGHFNTLTLEMFFNMEGYHYSYNIYCEKTQKVIRTHGSSYHHAMDYLLDNDCFGK